MAYPSFLSSCTFCHHYRRPVASLHPSSSCTTTILLPNPCPPLSPWNARHNGGGGDVGGMQTCDWLEARWRHGGESLHALGCNPPLDPLLSRSRIPLSRAARGGGGGAIGIEKWCTPVQSHSFPRLSVPRGRRAPLSHLPFVVRQFFRGCLTRLSPSRFFLPR